MATFLLRVDNRDKINKMMQNREIEFSCPANWYDYNIKTKNNTIGDQRECVYAHIEDNDPRINELDYTGAPMGNNLTKLHDDLSGTVYLRHEPVLLTPTLCFFECDIRKEEILKNNGMRFDITSYCKDMKQLPKNSALLVIRDSQEFEKDLKNGIIKSVMMNNNKLETKGEGGYRQKFDEKNPLDYDAIDYEKHDFDKLFYDINHKREEMWWKHKDYSNQSEGRFVIPHVHFKQRYGNGRNYNWKENTLTVGLERIKCYASIIDPCKCDYIFFGINQNGDIVMKGAFV